jgi:hypothetical protein
MADEGGPAKRARTDVGVDEVAQVAGGVDKKTVKEVKAAGDVAELSAPEVSNMVTEMLTTAQKAVRAGQPHSIAGMLRMCFSANVVGMQLHTLDAILTGRDAIIERILRGVCAPNAQPIAQPLARVFIECSGAPISFCLDIYSKQAPSPVMHVGSEAGVGTVALFRVKACQIDQILTSEGGGLKNWWRSRETLEASATWKSTVNAVKHSLTAPLTLTAHFTNYADADADAGPAATWTEELQPPPSAEEVARAKAEDTSKAVLGFEKVAAHLAADKKFAKAAPLLVQMLGTHLDGHTAPAAMAALRTALGPRGARIRGEATRDLCLELVAAAWEKRGALGAGAAAEAAELESWHLHAANAHELDTDDTFAFAKAAKAVQQQLEAMGAAPLPPHRADALTANLDAMVARYTFAWARAPVDMCFKILVDPRKRACLGDHARRVESLAAAVVAKRNAKGGAGESSYQHAGFQHGRMGW